MSALAILIFRVDRLRALENNRPRIATQRGGMLGSILPIGTNIEIRRFSASDSIAELTDLLHAAYRRLGDIGFNYTAVDQPPEVTMERIARGECLVALADRQLVGTIVFHATTIASGCPWYDRPDVAGLGQFAVHPKHQSAGIGQQLLAAVERRAAETKAREIALDTAEGAAHLVSWYQQCGYRLVEHAQWPGKTYRSVIMSKPVGGSDRQR